jgi:hypothetical protein
MSTNAEAARKDLRYYKRLEKAMKSCAVQNAVQTTLKKSFLHFVLETPKE